MDGPESGRKRTQLDAFHPTSFDERNRILKVVMRVLSAIGCEDTTRRHRFAVYRFYDPHLIGADFDQRHFTHDFFKRKLDKVQPWLQYVRLNTDFAFGSHHSSRRHFCSLVSSFLDRNFTRVDVDENAPHDDEEENQKNEDADEQRQHRCDIKIFHGMSLSTSTEGS